MADNATLQDTCPSAQGPPVFVCQAERSLNNGRWPFSHPTPLNSNIYVREEDDCSWLTPWLMHVPVDSSQQSSFGEARRIFVGESCPLARIGEHVVPLFLGESFRRDVRNLQAEDVAYLITVRI